MRFQFFIFLLLATLASPVSVFSQLNEELETVQSKAEIACDDNTWAIIKKTKSIEAYNEFLTACPDSRWTVLARHLMKSLEQDQAQQRERKISLATKHDVDW